MKIIAKTKIGRFVMVDPDAVYAYLERQHWQDLPIKLYTHKGE